MSRRSAGASRAPTPNDIERELVARLSLEEGDDFSMVQAPSVVSSLAQLSARGGGSRGESLISPPTARATSLPGSSRGGFGESFFDTPTASSSLQKAVFIDENAASKMCLGIIGSSVRFCIAPKVRGANHCGTGAHAKNKFQVCVNCFYPPAGSVMGRLSAKRDVFIARAEVPRPMLPIFESGALTAPQWVARFQEAIAKGPSTPLRVRTTPPPDVHAEGIMGGSDDESCPSQSSVISMLDIDVETGSVTQPPWTSPVEGENTIANWVEIMEEQRVVIQQLCYRVEAMSKAFPKMVDKLNRDVRPRVLEAAHEVRKVKLSTEEFVEQVGSLVQLVNDHGSLAQAVNEALTRVDMPAQEFDKIEEQMQEFADNLTTCTERTEQSKETLLSLINRVSLASKKRSERLELRIGTLEGQGVGMGGGRQLPGSGLTPDTSFGKVVIGSTQVELTMDMLLSQLKTLEARVQTLAERARGTSVVFHKLAFSLEAEFGRWYLALNPSGEGPSAFVDIVSIWSFAPSEAGTAEWLVEIHRSKLIGFMASADTLYAHSMTTRYPRVFVGKVESILSSHTIKMLESVETWRGNGMGDGSKETLLDRLRFAVASHASYCEDYLPEGPLRQAALQTAQDTQLFFQNLASYLDEELTMLTSFNLPSKQTLLLLSNQVVHICDDLFEYRNQAKGVDITNRVVTSVRYAWVTLQALGCMEAYLKDKFRKHPGINSTYMRFLTRNLADQSAMGLKGKVEAIATKVTKVEAAVAVAGMKQSVEKVDNKLEAIIKANGLKRTTG